MFQIKVVEKIKTHILCTITFFFFRKSCRLWDIWKNIVERGRPQMTIWRMRCACWTTKATNTHSEYVIFIAFLLQQWLHESASVLLYSTLPALLFSYRPRPCSPVLDNQGFGIAYYLHLECCKYQLGDSAVSQHRRLQFKHTIFCVLR